MLEKTNHSTIARFVNDSLRLLWPSEMENNCSKVLILLTDSAPYMLKAERPSKYFIQSLIHAHALHRFAELFPPVNDLISNGKKLFLKASARVQVYKDCLPEVPLPPEPVVTRWGTWLNAVSFYQKHFNEVKQVVGKLEDDYA